MTISAPPTDDDHAAEAWREVRRLVELVRVHLGMDVAFVGRLDGDRRHIEVVATSDPLRSSLLGREDPVARSICGLVADGTIGPVVTDARAVPALAALGVSDETGPVAWLGVPVRRADGSVWGTVCAFADERFDGDAALAAGTLGFVADVIAGQLDVLTVTRRSDAAARIDELIGTGGPRMVGQRIADLRTGETVGVEALARFDDGGPDEIFAVAVLGRRSLELELAAVGSALAALDDLPAGQWLSCNVGPRTMTHPRFHALLDGIDVSRLVVEVTEHERADHADVVASSLHELRRRGAGIALDDMGAAWSGLGRALELEPEIIKLDRALITGIHDDRSKRALVAAVQAFADSVGATVVAEGIEHEREREVLRELGVPLGQGWLVGLPCPLDEFTATDRA